MKSRRGSWLFLVETIVMIAMCYFLLGGSHWSPVIWAIFTGLTGWIIIMNIRYEAGLETVLSTLLCKLFMCHFLEERQVLPHFSYRV